MFTIENHIPPPIGNQGGNWSFPFQEMAIGDSVVIQNCTAREFGRYQYQRVRFQHMNTGTKFVSRRLDALNVRFWRVA